MALALPLVLMSLALCAQERHPRFRSGVGLVEVYVSVSDADGAPVLGLNIEEFEIFEEDRLQEVSVFSTGEMPLAVAVGVDRSFSMAGGALGMAKRATSAFLRSLQPDDRSLVLSVGTETEVVAPFNVARERQIGAVEQLDAWGTTALLDATVVGLDRLAPEPGRQVLVMFSDGIDRYSRTTVAEALEYARRSNALVYPISIGRRMPPLMVELAAATGGRALLVPDAGRLDPALASILVELRSQYLLGFIPDRGATSGTPEWRTIRVRLVRPRPGVRVRARDGYLAH